LRPYIKLWMVLVPIVQMLFFFTYVMIYFSYVRHLEEKQFSRTMLTFFVLTSVLQLLYTVLINACVNQSQNDSATSTEPFHIYCAGVICLASWATM
jgi:lipid-A-disaccharide synthase-like uncharacterized protein